MKLLVTLALLLTPLASLAADEPEVVYGKFHRAAMSGELEEMLRYEPNQRRNEMRGLSESHRDAALKMVQFMMPRAFTLERKMVNANSSKATLIVSGPWEGGRNQMEPVYGTVHMLMENGEWKVDEVNWNSEKPAILATPKPVPQAPAAKGAVSGKGAPMVGSMASESPGRKLGEAKTECVYKPVMTAQDMENCK